MRHAWILAPLLLAGCGQQVPLWTADYAAQQTTRSYAAVPPAKAAAAAEQVVRLAGTPRDVQVKQQGQTIVMHRYVNSFAGLGAAITDYTFTVAVTPDGSGSRVSLAMGSDRQDMSPDTRMALAQPSPLVNTPHINVADPYRLFFARMDYLLGKRADWVSCAQAKAKLGVSIALDPLCSQARDAAPAAAR